MRDPEVAAVIPVHNGKAHTLKCLEQLRTVDHDGLEIVLVDDGSTDGTSGEVARLFPEVKLLRADGSLYWSGAMNRGIRDGVSRDAQYVLSLNNDVVLPPDFLQGLVSLAQEKHAIVGPRIHDAAQPERVWQYGYELDWRRGVWPVGGGRTAAGDPDLNVPQERVTVTGFCALFPVEVFRKVGYYDEEHFPMYFGDVDLVLRARRAGFPVWVTPESVVYNHVEHTSSFEQQRFGSLAAALRYALGIKSSIDPLLCARFFFRHRGLVGGFLPSLFAALYFVKAIALAGRRVERAKP